MAKKRPSKAAGSTARNSASAKPSLAFQRPSAPSSDAPPEAIATQTVDEPSVSTSEPPTESDSTNADQKVADLQRQVNDRDQNLAAQLEANTELQAEVAQLKHQLTTLQADLQHTHAQHATAEKRYQALESDLIAQKQHVQQLSHQLQEYDELQQAHDHLKQTLTDLNNTLKAQSTQETAAIAQLQEQLQRQEDEHAQALRQLQAVLTELTAAHDAQQTKNEVLKRQNADFAAQISQLQTQLQHAHQTLEQQQYSAKNLQHTVAQHRQHIEALQSQLQEAQTLARLGELQVGRWQRTFSR